MRSFTLGVLAVVLLSGGAALAQQGRTDGPEGSEVGHGGYTSSMRGTFALGFDFGGNVPVTSSLLTGAAPIYLGGTASAWVADWFVMDLAVNHAFNTQTTGALIGPRFRSWTWPVSIGGGLRAGAMFAPGAVRFALSPIFTLDMTFMKHLLMGLQASYDIPVGGGLAQQLRIGINIGWRF
ncbi:MAG: hypothetical protein K1X64_17940 [Myxococcaceae bacterium]|nr:hypothetical protein [Myxococcaceae bacterium]